MKYRITEIKTRHDVGHKNHTYMIVEYLDDLGNFVLRNDFCRLMPLTRLVNPRDGDGNPRLVDGSFADMAKLNQAGEDAVAAATGDPAKDLDVIAAVAAITDLDLWRDIVDVDARAELEEAIRSYWAGASAANWTGDHTPDVTKPFYKDGVYIKQSGVTMPERDDTDPRGVATKVQTMVGKDVTL